MKKIDYYQQRRREQYRHDYTQYPLPCNTRSPAIPFDGEVQRAVEDDLRAALY